MTAAQKAAAKAAREADARRAAATSLTEEELTAILKTKRDAAAAAAAAAAKTAADAEAARAAQEAEEAAAPTGGAAEATAPAATEAAAASTRRAQAAAETTAPAATAEVPAGSDSEAAETRMCRKLLAMIKDSGLLSAAPEAPAAVGGPERPAAERSPEPLQPSTSEEDQVINLYRGALPQAASTTSSTPLLAQAQQDLAAARREMAAAANKERTAQQLVDKIAELPRTSFGGHVDLAGTERQGGYYGGASSSSVHGLGGGLSGGGGGGGAGLRNLGEEGTRLSLAETSAQRPVASTSGSTTDQPHPYQEFFTQDAVVMQERLRVLTDQFFKKHSKKEASIVTMKALAQYSRMLISREKQYQGLKAALAEALKTRLSSDLVALLKRLVTVEELDVKHLTDQKLLLEGMLQLYNFADDTADPQAFRQAVSKKWGLENRDPSKFQPTLEAFVEGAIYAEMIKAQVALDAQGPGHGVGGYKRSTRAAGFDDVPGGVDPSRHGSSYQKTADGGAGGQASKGTKAQLNGRHKKRGGGGSGGSGGGGDGKAGRR